MFAWLLFLTSCMIMFARSCARMVTLFDELHDYLLVIGVRMVTVFDELHDYFRSVLDPHGSC